MDFIRQLDTMALGSRIRNLGDLLMKDMARVYKEYNVDFEPRWFTTFQLILERGELTVTEIAKELGQTHPAAVQVVNALVKKKLASTRKDANDQRKRLVKLTRKGKKLAEMLAPLWVDVHAAAMEIVQENAPDILDRIAKLEQALKKKSSYTRIREKMEIRSRNNFVNQ